MLLNNAAITSALQYPKDFKLSVCFKAITDAQRAIPIPIESTMECRVSDKRAMLFEIIAIINSIADIDIVIAKTMRRMVRLESFRDFINCCV